ncbi:MAG: L-lactate permease [Planctomycetota bacterium]|jgi:lactate permease|nr:L-lactate permease [Planctomycetota bacterium]
MDPPITLLTWGAAVLSIAALLALLVCWQWGVAEAASVGLGISLVTAFAVFKGSPALIAGELAKGIWGGIAVMAVVVPAILIFEVTDEAKAFDSFRRGMRKFSPDELLQILTIGWVFASFLQGVTGFGVPVAIVAPLLVGIGVKPFWAVAVPLIGHAWATTFGTLAVAWEALVLQASLSGDLLLSTAVWAGVFTWAMDFTAGAAICWFYAGREGVKRGLAAILSVSCLHGGGQLILSQFNQVLCNFLVSSAGLILAYVLGRTVYARPYRHDASRLMDKGVALGGEEGDPPSLTLHQAFLPYYILTAVTLFVLLVPPVKRALSFLKVGLPFPETATGYGFVNPAVELYAPITVFTHAGVFLTLASVIGYFFFKTRNVMRPDSAKRIAARTLDKAAPATIAVILLIAMSKVMGGTGQVLVLARGTALVTGKYYALFAPFIGVLGAFMTSSCMASNILFGSFQQTMADLLQLDQAVILGAQTGGGAIGNVICPGNVLLGTTTAGILGREGELLKKLIPLGCAVALACGVIAFFAS